ncbi:TIGR04255 family protein [Rhizobium mongolense]|uniref:Uncharacterized protein (TIGR04255 family) n=1 Tax=Rhizobium mongolense TaxID=57676 RepID=A0A7W6RRH8_9HYPH|nr:TIGR04255 family protein [Rhizobium mongolense]MBB4276600.1 uncharacterized protein (TIGR04255 family) [Rhizobium mongolense]
MTAGYRSPPIVESVLEFRFASPLDFETIEKRTDKLKRYYPHRVTQAVEFNAEMSDRGISGSRHPVGLRFTTPDELQVMMVNVQALAIAQLAPYPGWDAFRERIKRDIERYIDSFGRRPISRIGMRYINRIDAPAQAVNVEDYLRVFPSIPHLGGSIGKTFALQVTHQLPDHRFDVTLQSATVDSPVPNNLSFLLDIDLFTTVDIPTRDDQIFKLLDEMRVVKNSIFESSITDSARKLFN